MTADDFNDAFVLLTRIFSTDDELFMFGEDGYGRYGQSSQVLRAKVSFFTLPIESPGFVRLKLFMNGYDANVTGHAATDKNLEICLNMKFKQCHVNTGAWSWAPLELQGTEHITLIIDVQKLLYS